MDEIDALFDVLDEARAALTFEEREGVADAIDVDPAVAAVTPRSRPFLLRLRGQLDRIARSLGDEKSVYWTRVVREDITEPTHPKAHLEDWTADELEREIERRKKYR